MRYSRLVLLAGTLSLVAATKPLTAQGHPPGPPLDGAGQQDDGPGGHDRGPGRGGNGPGHGPPPGGDHGGPPPPLQGGRGTGSTMRGGLQLGPPGRWWNDKDFSTSLHLQPDQQARMDRIFTENKSALLARYNDLKQQERQLESLTRTPKLDEQVLFAGIDHVAGARAALEKANAHMLLLLRAQLTPDQLKELDEHRPSPQ